MGTTQSARERELSGQAPAGVAGAVERNEDWWSGQDQSTLLVASGSGGLGAGDVAVRLLREAFERQERAGLLAGLEGCAQGLAAGGVREALLQANACIFSHGRVHPESAGLAASAGVAWLEPGGRRRVLRLCRVGDGVRAWVLPHAGPRVGRSRLCVLPADQPEGHLRAPLGLAPVLPLSVERLTVFPGDVLVLATPGVWRWLSVPEECAALQGWLASRPGPERAYAVEALARGLVARAHQAGGADRSATVGVLLVG